MNIPEVTNADVAFGTTIGLPDYDAIPDEFKNRYGNKWVQLFNDWFFCGLKKLEFIPKENVDVNKAIRHIKALMCSFSPSHEHKTAGVAYLMSQYFEDVKYEKCDKIN